MLETLDAVVHFLPWWAWLIAAIAAGCAFMLSSATALAVTSAYGANYRALSTRQRTMGRLGSTLSLLAMPSTAIFGMLALGAAVWNFID